MSVLKQSSSTDMSSGHLNFSHYSYVGISNALIPNKKIRTISNKVVDDDIKNCDTYDECSQCEEFCTLSRGARACSSRTHIYCASCISSLKFCTICGVEFLTSTNQESSSAVASPPAPPEFNVSAKANAQVKSERCDAKAEAEAPFVPACTKLEVHSPRRESPGRQCNFPGCRFVASSRAAAVDHLNKQHMDELLWTNFDSPSTTSPAADRGSLATPTQLPQLLFKSRIQYQRLKRDGNRGFCVYGMCAPSHDVLLLACGRNGLRALSLHSEQIAPRPVCTFKPYRVAFDTRTESLLLLVERTGASARASHWLLSLRLVANEWHEIDCIATEIRDNSQVNDFAVCDSRVLLAYEMPHSLDVFEVSADHRVRAVGPVVLANTTPFYYFACSRLDADFLVALAHYRQHQMPESVSLNRLVGLILEPLAVVELTQPNRLLFFGNLLLVADRHRDTNAQVIVSLLATATGLSHQRQLLHCGCGRGVDVKQWCVAGDQLVVQHNPSGDFLIYAFK